MARFCDVALPVPLDQSFTYRFEGAEPAVGVRVVVPFRQQKLSGIVVAVHDSPPSVEAKLILRVLDTEPVLNEQLLELGRWIAGYYIAPIGEVYRTMLPLNAEFRRAHGYRITERGQEALYASAEIGSSLRAKKDTEHQMLEYAVLNHLADGEVVREQSLRSATQASREIFRTMLSKKWIDREDLSAVRDATRTVSVAALKEITGKINANQEAILLALKAAGGRLRVDAMRDLEANGKPVPRSTLSTLVKRDIVEIVEEPAGFRISSLKPRKLEFLFTPAQQDALRFINTGVDSGKFTSALLHGVTGSGKTAVYLSAMQEVLGAGRSAILLVPEIGLTPAVAADLHEVFGEQVAILHSGLSDDERAEQWHQIRRGEKRIVVGTRSAVFAPVSDLALLIVDEEHDHSYKQEEVPRYHARDVAVVRAKMAGATVVLGSATPSMETYFNAEKGKYALLSLPGRVQARPLPEVEVIDMRLEFQETGHESVLSRKLVEEVNERLERGEQAMILLNRRGFANFVLCRACGKTIQCRNCAIALTFHKRDRKLMCHYCGYLAPVPRTCPECHSEHIQFFGMGSEKLEELLHGAFPKARIGRLDRDTVRGRDDLENILTALHHGEIDLLVGTQMIAKGHDIHGVTLVGVVGADAALGMPDFRAAERTFQLLTQVAGRAGRGNTPGKVLMQSYHPDHYVVDYAAKHDFQGFYEKESRLRSWMHYPPYTSLANVLVRSDRVNNALTWSGLIGKWFETVPHEGVRVMGPAAAPIERLKNDYRYHFILKSRSREQLNSVLRALIAFSSAKKIPRTAVIVDVDALSLM
ncbi:replication restart DNA helicase PriA [Candidatus Koribacter versatilis Ellin345]|uniref:Replication restart protein PriA n=1 Tax=Koribacter versatilis (strain Ellin345) TaxID=204669 RepID=Q1IK26_KORVE|nr:primosomal protein N' [Candidatus Koribacter versatilis]ABF42774.1 replication restart DNA helicase PriA [Candidatus Koribacter versatilis Ellin345]